MTDIGSNQCEHGALARQCPICERDERIKEIEEVARELANMAGLHGDFPLVEGRIAGLKAELREANERIVKLEAEVKRHAQSAAAFMAEVARGMVELREANELIEDLSYRIDAKHARLVKVADKLQAAKATAARYMEEAVRFRDERNALIDDIADLYQERYDYGDDEEWIMEEVTK